ncbi:MAG: D-alanine--D-alanine ligase, partial [Chloroflexi bacterium]|nr:D-alanine--D-alanine ligase [Chloroflexota bacterium]
PRARFTGADAEALGRTTHKAVAKRLLRAGGVPTPEWGLCRDPARASALGGRLGFPLMVKPVAEDGSLGVAASAVVRDASELEERVVYVLERYGQLALVERFVVGREINVSLWDATPRVLPPSEVEFLGFADPLDCILSFAAKWQPESHAFGHTPVVCPARVSPALTQRLQATALRAWELVGGRGYGRVDLRVADDGTPYVLEVNCNPDLSPEAGFFRAAAAAGYGYTDMITTILRLALE